MGLKDKFAAANTTNDGHLTQAQAKTGGMTQIANKFDQIDTAGRGYVTLEQVMAFRNERKEALEKQYNVPPKV